VKKTVKVDTNITEQSDGSINVELKCSCGKPIVKTDKYGMRCEDDCGLEESIEASKEIEKLIKDFQKGVL
jgi:hypothetical protein